MSQQSSSSSTNRITVHVMMQPTTQVPGYETRTWPAASVPAPSPPLPPKIVPVPPLGSTCCKPDLLHDCSCGPMCQCVGCISHPFNAATRQLISSVYQGQEHTRHLEPIVSPCCSLPSANNTTTAQSNAEDAFQMDWPVEDLASLSADPNPVSIERISWDDNFMFVDYPLHIGQCQGNKSDCMCGPSCQCGGCVIHGN